MKKVKIMLAAITILATVGGALAFKENNMRSVKYCISKIGDTCTFTITSRQVGGVQVTAALLPLNVTRCTLARNGAGTLCPDKFPLGGE